MIGINNPMNIRRSSSKWLGQTGSRKGFCCFENEKYCFRAAMYLVYTYRVRYHCDRLCDIISRYAPPSENLTYRYIQIVVERSKLPSSCDIDTKVELFRLIKAMAFVESNIFVDDTTLLDAFNLLPDNIQKYFF